MEPGQQRRHRGLAGTGPADERGDRPGLELERDVVEHRNTGPVREADIVELHRGEALPDVAARVIPGHEFGFVERDLDAASGEHAVAQAGQTVAESEEPRTESGAQEQEREQRRRIRAAGDQ